MPDLSKTAPEQRGMPELLAAPAPCGPRPADRNLHTIRSEVKMPCLRAGRANNHAQSGSELYAILPISKRTFSYRTRPGSRHGPGKGSPDAGSSSVGAIRPSWLTRTLAWASADPYARRSATRAVPLLSGARRPAVPHAAPPCRSPPLHGNHWTPLAKSPG